MIARIKALWLDDPGVAVFTLDAALDREARRIQGDWRLFGAVDFVSEAPRPFMLDAHGVLDFGVCAPARDRFWRASARQAVMRVGERFTVIFPQGERGEYRIVKVAEIGSKMLTRTCGAWPLRTLEGDRRE